MKTNKIASIVLLTALFTGACKQSPIVPMAPVDPDPVTPSAGSANFSKFIALGDSYVAGMQAGALFTSGQNSSVGKILATQFALAGGGTFNQPDINHANGFNASFSALPGTVRGRLVLFDPDGATDPDGAGCQVSRSAAPRAAGSLESTSNCPTAGVITAAMPAPYNTAQSPLDPLFQYAGDKLALNNYGVPGTKSFHTTAAAFGNSPLAGGNPFYWRFATASGTSTLLGDAAARAGTFFMINLGSFDYLNYATTGGGAGTANPPGVPANNDMTSTAIFDPSFDANLNTLLGVTGSKGVVCTIPDVTTLPYFTTVLWNQIEFKATNCTDAATLATLNGAAGFGGYNGALDFLASPAGGNTITAAEAAKRKVVYAYGKNGILIKDKTLADLTAALAGINPALGAYGQVRQANSTDIITLAAGSVLGTCPAPPNLPTFVTGVSAPLDDIYVLLPSETVEIQARIDAFNTKIKAAAAAASDRVAVADINAAYKAFFAAKVAVANGVTITPSFAPPAGAFSEDGLHPNGRGSAYTANIIIDAINAKFGAAVPKASLAAYSGTGLPVNP